MSKAEKTILRFSDFVRKLPIKWIKYDKRMHFLGSFIFTSIFFILSMFLNFLFMGFSIWEIAMVSGIFISALGAYKELIHDKLMKKGNAELLDMVANLAGVAFSILIFVGIFSGTMSLYLYFSIK